VNLPEPGKGLSNLKESHLVLCNVDAALGNLGSQQASMKPLILEVYEHAVFWMQNTHFSHILKR
jgi:hypothetical protein